MLIECAQRAAAKMYTEESKQEHMVNDLKLLFQGLKLSMLLIVIIMLGFSLSLVSLILEGGIIYFIYKQAIDFYTAIRRHNLPSLDGNPENELNMLIRELTGDLMSFIKSSYVSASSSVKANNTITLVPGKND